MTSSNITNWKKLFANLLKIEELRKNFQFFADIFPEPVDRTMDIVEKRKVGVVSPFQFMAFGFSILALIQVSSPIFRPEFGFLEEFVLLFVIILFIVIFYSISYMIFQDVAKSNRTFDDFLQMSAIIAGMNWILTGIPVFAMALSETLGGILYLGAAIYLLVYTMKVWKRFWNMSYGKILLYSFFSGIAGGIVAVIAFVLVGLILSPLIAY